MSLHPPNPRRERILGFGVGGAGKSSAWLSIAEWMHKTQAPGHLHVMDTDNAWEAMRPTDGHLDSLITAYPIFEFSDFKPAVKDIRGSGTSDDWYVIDRGDPMWDMAQEGYAQKVYGEDADEFFLRHEINETNPGGDYGKSWVQMRRMYKGAGIDLIQRFPGHVLCLCAANELRLEDQGKFADDAEAIGKYKGIGMKPAGKKDLGLLFHTELYFVESPSGYRITTTKDRKPFGDETGRQYLKGKPVTPDFVMAYLIGVAGWRP